MKIRLELNTTRQKKDGTFPICILIQDGNKQKRISTGISAKKSHWHRVNEKFKDQNRFKAEQKILNKQKEKLLSRLKEIMEEGFVPSIDLLLSENNQKSVSEKEKPNNFIEIIQEYADTCRNKEGEESYNTKRLYISLKKFLEKHRGNFIDIHEFNSPEGVRSFIDLLNEEKRDKNVMKNRMITQFCTVLKFAQDNEYIDVVRVGKITKFDETPNHDKLNLKTEEITKIIMEFKKLVMILHPKYDKMNNEKVALYLWVFHVMLQGIDPIDMFKLRKKDIKIKTIRKIDVNSEKYYNNPTYRQTIDEQQEEKEVIEININRKKVKNAPTKILVDKETVEPLLELFYNDKGEEEFLIHNKLDYRKNYKDSELTKARVSFYNIKQDALNRLWKSFFIESERDTCPTLTYAHTRHAFINRLNDLEVKQNIISKFVGHQNITLDYYIDKRIPEWEHSEISSKVFNDVSSIKDLMAERDLQILRNPERTKTVFTRQDYGKSQYVTIDKYRKNEKG